MKLALILAALTLSTVAHAKDAPPAPLRFGWVDSAKVDAGSTEIARVKSRAAVANTAEQRGQIFMLGNQEIAMHEREACAKVKADKHLVMVIFDPLAADPIDEVDGRSPEDLERRRRSRGGAGERPSDRPWGGARAGRAAPGGAPDRPARAADPAGARPEEVSRAATVGMAARLDGVLRWNTRRDLTSREEPQTDGCGDDGTNERMIQTP